MKSVIIAFAALCVLVPQAQAHIYYFANLTAPGSSTPAAEYMSYVHMGEWHWSINTTVPLDSLEIVDKLGSVSSPTYTTAVVLSPLSTNGTIAPNGTFVGSDINPMVAGDAYALAGHMCMGHIYLRGNTTDGTSLLAPLTYVDVEDEGLTCDQAVEAYTGGVLPPMGSMDGMDGMSGMPGMSGMGDAPAPAASGAAANTVLGGTVVAALASVALAVL